MIRKIYRELVRIRKELHAIRNSMETFSEIVVTKSAKIQFFQTETNLDDKPTAEFARISATLNDITSKRYQGV